MNKIEKGDPDSQSADIKANNISQLAELFPEAMVEGKVDFEVLKQLLDGVVDENDEKYGLNWHGKRAARELAMTPSTGTLRPCPEDSVDWDSTQNLMIEGDNLEVLKILQKSYSGKVKMIYIDPPYNTGKDFVYKDNFRDGIKNYKELTGQSNDGVSLTSNPESSGRYHTDWLNMMLPRLKLAQNLLTQDGVIFASCDESEQPRLRSMMDTVFGEENFVTDFVWAAGRKNDSKLVSVSHEYIVCFVRNINKLKEEKVIWRQKKKGLDDIYAQHKKLRRTHIDDYATMTVGLKEWYKNLPEGHPSKPHKHYSTIDSRGIYFTADISWPGGGGPKYEILHPSTGKPVKTPARGWRISDPQKMRALIDDDRVHFGDDETKVPCSKSYLIDREGQVPYSVFYLDGRAASKRLRQLMGCDCFDFPKDETVLQELVGMVTGNQDIVMDFFAGSGTTGHAVMLQNQVDGGNRIHIQVQLPEPLDLDSKEQKVAAEFCDELDAPRNIAELTKERLRRAGSKIKEDNPLFTGDTGFRVFKLDSSNINAWDPDSEDLEGTLAAHTEHIKPDRTEDDVLYELLLKRGLDLCVPIEKKEVEEKTIHSIGGGVLFACLANKLDPTQVEAIAQSMLDWRSELNPAGDTTCVFRDSAFENDVAKTNMVAILKQGGIKNVRSL